MAIIKNYYYLMIDSAQNFDLDQIKLKNKFIIIMTLLQNCTDNQISTESRGILVCGTGIGISIAANKVPGIRCALCHDHYTVSMSRKHNNANVLAIGGRTTGIEIAKGMVDVFLSEKFDGGRHSRRVEKME